MRVIDDEQQITAQRRARRPQQRGRLAELRDPDQMAERAEWDHTLGRGAGDPVHERRRVRGHEVFGGKARQRGFADAVGTEDDRTGPGVQRGIQLLQGGRVLRDIPSNRHRRILRCVPGAG
ncbi:Uncharacterised protein [Mycobacterium tuberculosis]|nr:Uncharacterised protein [Mycobacterium tuberculosis]